MTTEVARQVVILPEASGVIEWEVTLILNGSGFDRHLDVSVKRLVHLPTAPEPVGVATMAADFEVVSRDKPGT